MSTLWRLVSFLVAMCFGCNAYGAKVPTNCTHAENIDVVRALKQQETISGALEQLKKRSGRFLILYRPIGSTVERAAKDDQIKTLHYSSLRVRAISHQSKSWLVSEDEFLVLEFDGRGLVSNITCKKAFTGP